ncbi:hypothetical protein BDZ97DRAFT_1663946, partial [Flammula alnicola]
CFTHGTGNDVHCVDALGKTATPFPSATTGLIPSSTLIPSSDHGVIYSPSDAWNISNIDSNCTQSKSLHVTDTANATVSFTYTNLSIMVNVVNSPNGGVFSVLVDGFNTTSTIDTFSGSESLPACYPLQFPPFHAIPPGYQSQSNHTLTLVYVGPSPSAPQGSENTSIVLFDSFSIPESVLTTNDQGATRLQNLNIHFFSIFFTLLLYVVF